MQDYIDIIETARKMYFYTNSHNWKGMLSEVFADVVTTDDSSYPGAPQAIKYKAKQLVDLWEKVHNNIPHAFHQMGNELVSITGDTAIVKAFVTATHFRPGNDGRNKWVVYSTFDISLQRQAGGWRIYALKQHFKFEEGKPELVMPAQTPNP